jgi:hypothetical protein
VADLAKHLGFAPVPLGKLNEGGWLVHARGRIWGQLIFQELFKKEQQSAYGRRSKSGETPDGAADLRVA